MILKLNQENNDMIKLKIQQLIPPTKDISYIKQQQILGGGIYNIKEIAWKRYSEGKFNIEQFQKTEILI